MATLEEMEELRNALSNVQFPPNSLGIMVICDSTGRIMFTSLSCAEQHDELSAETIHGHYNRMAVAACHRVVETFNYFAQPGALEEELSRNTLQ